MKINIKYYYLLLLATVCAVFFAPAFLAYGGISADSISYFRLANDFPNIKYSLFPLAYPAALKFLNFIFNDFYWSARVLNSVLILVIAGFSYFKKWHFRETVILLCTKVVLFNLFNFVSEGMFLTILYFLIYFFHQYFNGKITGVKFYLPAGLLLSFLFLTRYSAIYLLVGCGLFYIITNFKNRSYKSLISSDFFKFLGIAAIGVLSYANFNFLHFGDFAGEKFRNQPYYGAVLIDFYRNILSLFNVLNPVFGIKLNSLQGFALAVELILLFINIIFIYISVKLWRRYFDKFIGQFHQLLIIMGTVYAILVFITFYMQGIEELNIRMLAESSFCFYISLVFIYFSQNYNEKLIFTLAVFSLIFNTAYSLKAPDNFLDKKEKVEMKLSTFSGKKYYFIDTASKPKISTYKIPFIKKEIKYEHNNQQDFFINGNIIMTKNPEILWILKDTVQNKSQVIYSSDLQ